MSEGRVHYAARTFFNLSPEKQSRIIDAATGEFARKGYRGGSIREIAAEARVAKGSIYQYFHNKEDLFFYLVDLAVANQVDLFSQSVHFGGKVSFFDTLEALFDTGLRFAEENPGLFQICQDLKRGAPQESGSSLITG